MGTAKGKGRAQGRTAAETSKTRRPTRKGPGHVEAERAATKTRKSTGTTAAKRSTKRSTARTGKRDAKDAGAKKATKRPATKDATATARTRDAEKIRYDEHPGVYVMRSAIHGTGLFADADFGKGDKIVEYIGEKITKAESDRRYLDQEKRGLIYLFDLNKTYDLDGDIPRNPAKYANHSCRGNAETDIRRGRIWIIAKKRIRPDDEIVYDYNFPYDDWWERPCLCGAPNCRGYIIGADAARKLTQRVKRYGREGTKELDLEEAEADEDEEEDGEEG